jgi:hypothetical protein
MSETKSVPDVAYMCNALIAGRRSRVLRAVTDRFGNWIRGTVALRGDHVHFYTNRLNALMQEDSSDLLIPYGEITSCELGRLAVFLTTVDLETTRCGKVRFRCLLAWNETLLSELQKRIQTAA